MKRSEALTPLSHEHHQALFLAMKLRRAETIEPVRTELLEFWREEGELHFRIEEDVLLPNSGLAGPDQDPDVARLLSDHQSIRDRVALAGAGDASLEDLSRLGEELNAHVRFEERELFPRVEEGLDPESLAALAAAIEAADEAGRRA